MASIQGLVATYRGMSDAVLFTINVKNAEEKAAFEHIKKERDLSFWKCNAAVKDN